MDTLHCLTLLLLVNVKQHPPDAIISHCCSILTYSIVHHPAASWPCISCFTPLRLPLYAAAIVFAIPSSLLPLCLQKCSAAVVYQSQPRSYLVLIPSLPSSQFAQSPFFLQHLVFSLYHRWSTFHAGLLHALMPSLCVYAVCVLFVSPACHSETHWFVWGLSGSTQTFHSAGCHRGQAIKDYTSERESELSAGQ